MKRTSLFLVTGLALVFFASTSQGVPSRQLWTYGTTSKASGHYAIHVCFAQMINKYVPEVNCTPIETGATVDNWRRLEKGEIQIGFGSATADWPAFNGEGPFQGKPVRMGRTLWIDGYSAYCWVVHADSGIKTIYDLDHKKVNVGIAGSSSEEVSLWVLKLLGVNPSDIQRGSTADAVEGMQNRRIDAWLKGGPYPDSAIVSLGANRPVSVLNFSDADLAKLHADRPYVGRCVVDANIYKGVPKFQTYGTYISAVIRADIPQELQYKIIKAVYGHWDEFMTVFPQYRRYPDLLKLTAEDAIVPLAAGTVQYLQEKGYSVPEKVIPPEYKKK